VTISREQCRAARSLLDWSQPDLAKALGVAQSTIAHFERGASKPHARTLAAIRATLETAGIIFIEGDDKVGPGVQLRDPLIQ
jgi:transcriptional regulator with XRE-family HTH domain